MSVEAVQAINSAIDPLRAKVAGAIKQGSSATGASFEYLLATAKMESNFNPGAAATTSSARGLFQFIEQTWLGTVKEAGAQFGYGNYADAISKSESGRYSVSDPAAKAAILKLRDDPVASSAMAGVLTQSNSFKLTGMIGRRPTDSELYMAHFMGVGGAARLISKTADDPGASAATLFPAAAAANQSIFYDRAGNARSVSDVYAVLNTRYATAAGSQATRTTIAALGTPALSLASAAAVDNAAYLSSFPDTRTITPARNDQAMAATSRDPGEPMFRTLFQAGDRAQPVAPAVQELWGTRVSLSSHTPEVGVPKPLDLFSDRTGQFSS
jgi:hypothetical protein